MLKTKIEADFIAAFKAKDTLKKDTLGSIKSKLVEYSKTADSKEIDDAVVLSVLASEIKKREQTVDMIKDQPQAKVLYDNTLLEISYLKDYLPKQLEEDEIRDIVKQLISLSSIQNKGQLVGIIMKEFNAKYKGQFNSKRLQEIINE